MQKRFVLSFIVALAILLSLVATFNIFIDPFNVWHKTNVVGLNNYKYGQEKFNRVNKTFELFSRDYDVVFFGDSRVLEGMPAYWPDSNKVYNAALSGGSILESEKLIYYYLKKHKPKQIVVGLSDASEPKPDFSESRIKRSIYAPSRYIEMLKETVYSYSATRASLNTVEESQMAPGVRLYNGGTKEYSHLGRLIASDGGVWDTYLQGYLNGFYQSRVQATAPDMSLIRSQVDAAVRIKQMCESANVPVSFAYLPQSIDYMMVLEFTGRISTEQELRKQLIENQVNFYDFSLLNDVTLNRNNFLDPIHFRTNVGKMIIHTLAGKPDIEGFGLLTTKETVQRHVQWTWDQYNALKQAQPVFFDVLRSGKYFDMPVPERAELIGLSHEPTYKRVGIQLIPDNTKVLLEKAEVFNDSRF